MSCGDGLEHERTARYLGAGTEGPAIGLMVCVDVRRPHLPRGVRAAPARHRDCRVLARESLGAARLHARAGRLQRRPCLRRPAGLGQALPRPSPRQLRRQRSRLLHSSWPGRIGQPLRRERHGRRGRARRRRRGLPGQHPPRSGTHDRRQAHARHRDRRASWIHRGEPDRGSRPPRRCRPGQRGAAVGHRGPTGAGPRLLPERDTPHDRPGLHQRRQRWVRRRHRLRRALGSTARRRPRARRPRRRGHRTPFVLPFSAHPSSAPESLQRTLDTAISQEAGTDPGTLGAGSSSRTSLSRWPPAKRRP